MMSQKISSRWHFHISAYKCQEASWVHKSWVPGEAIRMGVSDQLLVEKLLR